MSNLTKQVQKARSAQRFASVIQRDHQKRAQSVLVPGSNAKIYRVILRRTQRPADAQKGSPGLDPAILFDATE